MSNINGISDIKDRNLSLKEKQEKIKEDLAWTYRIFAHLGMADLTYTHLSARCPGEDAFFIYPLGMFFEEVSVDNLLKVSFDGEILEGFEKHYNMTGYVIHSSVYKNRSDINAVFHLHSPDGVAVSAYEKGLLPLSQFSFHFFEKYSRSGYNSLALSADEQGHQMAKDLGPVNKVMLLDNHGTLSAGETIQEAFFLMYYLERACKVQNKLLPVIDNIIIPEPEICRRAQKDMRNFEKDDWGRRDWEGLKRRLIRLGEDVRKELNPTFDGSVDHEKEDFRAA